MDGRRCGGRPRVPPAGEGVHKLEDVGAGRERRIHTRREGLLDPVRGAAGAGFDDVLAAGGPSNRADELVGAVEAVLEGLGVGVVVGDDVLDDGAALLGGLLLGRARARLIIMETERRLGFEPTDRELEKLGYDIESRIPGTGRLRFIEVKGRVSGADVITVTRNEILYSLNQPEDFILAMVEFSSE